MPRPSKLVDVPKLDPTTGKPVAQLRIWVLLQEEIEQCASMAAARARRALAKVITDEHAKPVAGTALGDAIDRQSYSELYDNIRACEILWRACRNDKDVSKLFFPTVEHVRKFTADEVGVLMSYYASTQSELGPISATMTSQEVEAWIERLAISGERYPLGSLSPEAHQALTFSLALLVRSLRTASSSAGSQPESDLPPGQTKNDGDAPTAASDVFDESSGSPPTE